MTRILISEIDDWVDAWHTTNTGVEKLQDYLGMTEQEYVCWLSVPSRLAAIIRMRKPT